MPAGPINRSREVFADPQVIARGMRVDLPHPDAKGGNIPACARRSPSTAAEPPPTGAAEGRRAHGRSVA